MTDKNNSKKPKNFTRVIEDFICENCGTEVKGNGYTNHCPKCLWSKHVDKDFLAIELPTAEA